MTNRPSYTRFYRAFALSVVLAAALSSLTATLHFAWGLRVFGGLEYVPRVVALSATRVLAPGVVVGMSFLAWVIQSHGWDLDTTRRSFRPLAWRALLSSIATYLPCLGVMLAVSLTLCGFLYDTNSAQFLESSSDIVSRADLLYGFRSCLFNLVPLLVIGYFAMPRLAASGWRLGTKLLVLWAGGAVLRLALELLASAVALLQA